MARDVFVAVLVATFFTTFCVPTLADSFASVPFLAATAAAGMREKR